MTHTRTRPLLAALAAVGVAAAGLTAGVAAAPTAEGAPAKIRVISHNIAKKPEALGKVIQLANSSDSPGDEVVFLQEVCQSMLPRIRQDLGRTQFHIRRTNQGDCSDNVIGEAVVFTGKGGAVEGDSVDFNLPGQDQTYGMACLNFTYASRSTRACSTHLPSGKGADRDALRLGATRFIREKATHWDKQNPVLVGGDFNSTPDARAMNQMYGVGDRHQGNFLELNQTAGSGNTARAGLFTIGKKSKGTDRKVDYVFSWKPKTARSGGSVHIRFTPSNHRMLFGSVPVA